MIMVFALVVFIVLAAVVLLALGLVAAIIWAVVWAMLVAAAAAGVAFAVAVAVSLLVTGGADVLASAGIAAGIIAFFVALGVLVKARGRRRRRQRLMPASKARIDVAATVVPPVAMSRDPALDAAFAALAEHADGSRARLAVAQESCRLFLVLADRFPMDNDAGDLKVRIRRRVPEHVTECLRAIESATATERRQHIDDAVRTLEQVGAEAERHRQRLQVEAAHELELQRRHLTRGSEPPLLSPLG